MTTEITKKGLAISFWGSLAAMVSLYLMVLMPIISHAATSFDGLSYDAKTIVTAIESEYGKNAKCGSLQEAEKPVAHVTRRLAESGKLYSDPYAAGHEVVKFLVATCGSR
ncbi:MAG: hypothetical protein OQJ87_12150 [Rhodospirillales bacterium]|nr:hypothetical protein [Rhodospirillales bacterium]